MAWNKNFEKEAKSFTLINLKKLDLEIQNESFVKDKKYLAKNNIFFRNSKLYSNFQIQNDLISFNSQNSKIINNNLKYMGEIYKIRFTITFYSNIKKRR